MIIGMFLSMSLDLFGVGPHKMLGLLTFLLFIAHNFLNRKWYKTLFSGNYSAKRILHTLTNMLVIISMFGIILSGVMLSKEIATGVTVSTMNLGSASPDVAATMSTGRLLHIASSYLNCIGIAFHIGFHLKRRKDNV